MNLSQPEQKTSSESRYLTLMMPCTMVVRTCLYNKHQKSSKREICHILNGIVMYLLTIFPSPQLNLSVTESTPYFLFLLYFTCLDKAFIKRGNDCCGSLFFPSLAWKLGFISSGILSWSLPDAYFRCYSYG